jgi:excisionase family DNA binding protein
MHRKYLRPIEPEAVTFDSSVELMDVKEAAAFLRLSVSGMRRLQQQREVSYIKVGGALRFAKSDLLGYITRKRIAAVHELI